MLLQLQHMIRPEERGDEKRAHSTVNVNLIGILIRMGEPQARALNVRTAEPNICGPRPRAFAMHYRAALLPFWKPRSICDQLND